VNSDNIKRASVVDMSSRKATCDLCGDTMWACNLPRHKARVHEKSPPEDEGCTSGATDSESSKVRSKRCRSTQSKPNTSQKAVRCTQSKASSSTMKAPSNDDVKTATLCMLRRTEGINIPDLTNYLERYFPTIPDYLREPVIVATFSAAERVARAHVEMMLVTNDDDKRETHLKRSMAKWLNGLSYLEPGYAGSCSNMVSDARSNNSATCEAYSPSSNFMLNREIHVPFSLSYLQQQFEMEMQVSGSNM